MRVARLAALATVAVALTVPASALAIGEDSPRTLVIPTVYPEKPDLFAIGARKAIDVANATSQVADQREGRGRLEVEVADQNVAWEVSYFDPDAEDRPKVALVIVDGPSGDVREAWTGHQVGWPMARGYERQFGFVWNSTWVWLPLTVVFLLGLSNWRRPLQIGHLDLLVLTAGFGVSHIIFNDADVGWSVPLVYPPLLYLLARMCWVGLRGRMPALRPSAPTVVLAAAIVVLIGARVTMHMADSGVSDVGYAGVIGADRIERGKPIWGEGEFPEDNPVGDAYGPTVYLFYVPFEQIWPWSGHWDDLPAARAVAITADLLAALGMFFLGQALAASAGSARRRDRTGVASEWQPALDWLEQHRLGVILAFAWLAFPYTGFSLQSSTNDGLMAAAIIWSLALFARPVARGAVVAAAALTKFAPLVIVPLVISGRKRLWWPPSRRQLLAALGFAIVIVALLAVPALSSGLETFWDRAIVEQAERGSIFSIWGQADLGPAKHFVWVLVALFAAALAFFPKRRSLAQVCALAAAAVLAVQLTIEHWFYFYIPWFSGPLLAAILARPTARESARSG